MWRFAVLSTVLTGSAFLTGISGVASAHAQSPAPAAAKPAGPELYHDEALVFERFDTTVRMHADGTGERVIHVVLRIQSEGAARQFGVLSVNYASAYETGAIDFIHVRKPDGTTVETPTADAIEMPAPVTREAPLYSDLKEKQVPVRSLGAGDVLDYQLHTVRTKAEAPGQFWGAEHFTVVGAVVLSETLTLETPAATYVKVWSPNHPATPAEHDGLRVWHWNSAQTKPSGRDKDGKMIVAAAEAHDPDQDADGRALPSVAWTTFHSWAEVGAWYRDLAASRADPNDAIRAKADELTKDAKTPEEQTRALYRFVSTQVRYVGIDLGIGRYQPHPAAEVLATQYGDCKDKDTLLEALLHAKGFTTAPALIGVSIAPVAELPSPAVFNHVITTVEMPGNGGRIWLDATPEVDPYGELSAPIRDQQALVIPPTGAAALTKTPADPPFPFFERFTAVATLDKDGLLKGRMSMTVRSDNEPGFRTLLQRAAPSQWDDAVQYVSNVMGFGGKVTNADLHQTDLSGPMQLAYDYSRPSFGDWDNRRIVPLFPVLEIAGVDKEKAPEHDIDLGAPRTLEAHTEITLPAGFRADLPEPIHAKRPYATFDQTYRLEGEKLVIDRKSVILGRKVPKADWQDYRAYLKSIGMESGENYISLIAPQPNVEVVKQTTSGAKPKTTTTHAPEAPNSAAAAGTGTATELVEKGRQAEVAGDWDGARHDLDDARKLDPKAPYLMSMVGFLALRDRKPDEAITDFKAELHEHPDANTSVVLLLAESYAQNKQDDEAIVALKSYSSRNDPQISLALAGLQSKLGRHADAVATLEAAAKASPDDRRITGRMASELMKDHREVEAAAAAKAAMDGSDDPDVLNNNSYVLSELKMDLPLAEQGARQAIDLLEKSSAQRSLAEVNSKAFAESNELAATWDTLGWILFEEGKPKEAEPYIAAAWFNEQNVTVGGHLGAVREALGRPSEALTADELALATDHAADQAGEYASVKANADRLRKAGAQSTAGDGRQALQAMRMFRVKRPSGLKGWGTFRLQLAEGGVHDSDLVSGSAELKPINPELKKLTLAQAVPPGSHGYLLRDAVVSCTSSGADCDFVLMPHAGLGAEAVR